MAYIDVLLDTQDSNAIVRNQIAAIIAIEIANQKVLATEEGTDPDDYDFLIYIERSRPFEVLTSSDGSESGDIKTGLVNILFDNDKFDNKNSGVVERQRTKGTFYLDCYAHVNRTDSLAGDEATSKESDRIAAIIRKILMAGQYTYLALGQRELAENQLVFKRYIIGREKFYPSDREGRFYENIIGTRITIEVEYDEYSPQEAGVDFELLINTCGVGEDGNIYFDNDFDYTE